MWGAEDFEIPQWYLEEQQRRACQYQVRIQNGEVPERPLTEQRIREIVREEMAKAVK